MPKGHAPKSDVWKQAWASMKDASHGEKSIIVANLMSQFGVSKATVYRRLSKFEKSPKRCEREPVKYTDDLIGHAMRIQEEYRALGHRGGGRDLRTEDIITQMESEGLIGIGDWTVSGLNGALGRIGYRMQTPRVRVETDRYCQLWMLDFSRSKHFQVIKALPSGEIILKVSAKELHYKDPEEGRFRSWLCSVVDDHTRAFIVQYYADTSENGPMGLSHLRYAMTRPEDDHPMRHKPEALRGDQGAFMKSAETIQALEALEIERVLTNPGNKETQGKVERRFRTIWQQFEAPLAASIVRAQGKNATVTLAELNSYIMAWSVACLDNAHPTRRIDGKSVSIRRVLMESMLRERPKVVQVDLMDVAYRSDVRTADSACMISIDGVQYRVADHASGLKVEVQRYANGELIARALESYDRSWFRLAPYQFQKYGEFSESRPDTVAEKARKTSMAESTKREQAVVQMGHKADVQAPRTALAEMQEAEQQPETISLIEAETAFLEVVQRQFPGVQPSAIRAWLDRLSAEGQLHQNMERAQAQQLAHDFTDSLKTKMKLTG